LTAAVAAPAAATDWWLIGANGRGAMFVDLDSVRRNGDRVTQRVVGVMPGLAIVRIEAIERLDCRAGTATDLRVTLHLSDGTAVARPPAPAARPVRKGTVGGASFAFGCGGPVERGAVGTPVPGDDLDRAARLAIAGLG